MINKLPNNNNFIDSNLYDVIFSVGGRHENARAFIIDPKQYYHQNKNTLINVSYCKMPDISCNMSGAFSVYSKKHGLMQIGNNVARNKADLFNVFSFNDYKWISNDQGMQTERSFLSALMINDDGLFCCGGSTAGYVPTTDIYNFNTQKLTKLNDKNVKICRAGICFDDTINKRVYVGGVRIQILQQNLQ